VRNPFRTRADGARACRHFSADVAPEGGRYLDLQTCLCLFDILYERPRCRGLLTAGGKGMAAALVAASAALTVPPEARAAHAPALTWLAVIAGESVADVHDMAAEVLRCCLLAPHEFE
jgi:hypothetical protein